MSSDLIANIAPKLPSSGKKMVDIVIDVDVDSAYK